MAQFLAHNQVHLFAFLETKVKQKKNIWGYCVNAYVLAGVSLKIYTGTRVVVSS